MNEGMDEMELTEAESNCNDLACEYWMDHNDYGQNDYEFEGE